VSALGRREFLGVLGIGLFFARRSMGQSVQDSLPGAGPSGRLWDPNRAGPPLQPVTAEDNDAAIQAIEKQLKCTCGCGLDVYTCRTTDFTCPVSPKMHRRVIDMAKAGMSGQGIIAQFVSENGLEILMAPPKRGFNLAGYFVPAALILAVGAVLVVVMRRWVRSAPQPPLPSATPEASGASPAELERLREALQHTDA
jgi:cytochrome c-type biogenesis protein CcmH